MFSQDPIELFKELHADSFLRAYERCINPPAQGLGTPALICAALSAELGFKILLARNGNEKSGHNLTKLLEALPDKEKSVIIERLQEQHWDWAEQLEQASRAFVDWRYIYESKEPKEINIHFVGKLASVVNEMVRSQSDII